MWFVLNLNEEPWEDLGRW